MKALLAGIALRREIGVMIDEHEIAVSQVATTVFGPVELTRVATPYEPDRLAAALERVVKPLLPRKKLARMHVAVGLPMLRVFFSTRPIQYDFRDASPQVLLHEVLQSPMINIDDMFVDLIRTQPGRRLVASIASCRKKYLSGVLAALEGCEIRPSRVEPAPCALLRAAVYRHRSPQRAKEVLRIFLGEARALAVLTARDIPLIWRSFDLPPGSEAKAITSAIGSLAILGKYCGTEAECDAVMIHGRPDLGSLSGLTAGGSSPGLGVIRCEGPGLDNTSIAFGLALGCHPNVEAFNLARSLKSRDSIWEIFPLGGTIAQVLILLLSLFFLTSRLRGEKAAYQVARAEDRRHTWAASLDETRLEKEKTELEQKVEAIRTFLATRIVWSDYIHDIAARVSPDVKVLSFSGKCELELMDKKRDAGMKPKKTLVLRLASPIPRGGSMPVEIDRFLGSLRSDSLLMRDFPVVELADLQWNQPTQREPPHASFTVICRSVDAIAAKSAPAPAKVEKTKAATKADKSKPSSSKEAAKRPSPSPSRKDGPRPEARKGSGPKATEGRFHVT